MTVCFHSNHVIYRVNFNSHFNNLFSDSEQYSSWIFDAEEIAIPHYIRSCATRSIELLTKRFATLAHTPVAITWP